MRVVLLLAVLAGVPLDAAGSITFVTPLPGQQLVGPAVIEVTTSIASIDRVEFLVDGSLAGVVLQAPFRIVHDFGASLEPHSITARVVHDGFRSIATSTMRSGSLVSESIAVDLVEVPLRIRASGRVTAADLEIRENGVLQEVAELIAERPPSTFTYVVDRSLSMSAGKLDRAIQALHANASSLRAGDRAEVIFFNHTVSSPTPAGSVDASEVPPAGGTSLRDALLSVARDRRTIAIVISDGNDRNSFVSADEALRALSRSNLTLHALLLDRGNAAGFLRTLAERSGGRVIETSPSALGRDLRRLFEDINSRYTAVYQSRGTADGWRGISVKSSRRGVSIDGARKGYFAR